MTCGWNPVCHVGGIIKHVVGGAVGGLVTDGLSGIAKDFSDFFSSILKEFSAWFVSAGNVDVGSFTQGGIWQLELLVGVVICVMAVLIAAARTAWSHSGEAVATAVVGLVKNVVGVALIGFGVTTLMAIANVLTAAIISADAGSSQAFADNLGKTATVAAFTGPGSSAFLLIGGLAGAVVVALLYVEMLIRSAGIIIVTASAPIGAAGLLLPETAGWWRKLVSAELALIVIKPIIALVGSDRTVDPWRGGRRSARRRPPVELLRRQGRRARRRRRPRRLGRISR